MSEGLSLWHLVPARDPGVEPGSFVPVMHVPSASASAASFEAKVATFLKPTLCQLHGQDLRSAHHKARQVKLAKPASKSVMK